MNTGTDFAFSYIRNNYIQPFLWLTNLPVVLESFTILKNKKVLSVIWCSSLHRYIMKK